MTAQGKTPNPATVTTPDDREIHIERIFHAPRERVWQAMTDSALLAQWWGRGNRLDVVHNELKPGGRWRFVEHSDHGEFGFEGVYREIQPPERIVLTFGWDGMPGHEIVNAMRLDDLGDGRTRLVAISTFSSKQDRDGMISAGMEGGMNESYAALDRVLERMT